MMQQVYTQHVSFLARTSSYRSIWGLLAGIKILGISLEELLFVFTFGLYCSGLYEHLFWYHLKPDNTLSHA